MLNRRPGGPALCWMMAFSTASCLQLVSLQLSDFLSPPSYIIVQSPTQSLEWHVCSSSSGNNCHAVHKSLSSGASVYECTMGFLPCPVFSAKPAYVISSHKCHRNVSLPSGASLWNGMFGQVEGQYTTPSLSYYLPIAGGRILGFIPFPKGISAMWNAISLVQDLNSCRRVHFLWRLFY